MIIEVGKQEKTQLHAKESMIVEIIKNYQLRTKVKKEVMIKKPLLTESIKMEIRRILKCFELQLLLGRTI
jgi:hypothetical protein